MRHEKQIAKLCEILDRQDPREDGYPVLIALGLEYDKLTADDMWRDVEVCWPDHTLARRFNDDATYCFVDRDPIG